MQQNASNLVLSATAAQHPVAQPLREDTRLPGALQHAEDLLAAAARPGGPPPAAVAAGLRHILLDRLDLTVPAPPDGTAWLLAWLLRNRTQPFTPVLRALTGCEIRAETIPGSDGGRRLTGAQAVALNVLDEAGFAGWTRRAYQVGGTTICSETELILLPSRIGGPEMDRIKAGEPCGRVIPGLVRTSRLGRDCWPADPAVLGGALLQVAGRGIGLSRERVTAELIKRIPD
jgi:hypothetical protein